MATLSSHVKDVREFIICQRNAGPDSNSRGKGYLICMKLLQQLKTYDKIPGWPAWLPLPTRQLGRGLQGLVEAVDVEAVMSEDVRVEAVMSEAVRVEAVEVGAVKVEAVMAEAVKVEAVKVEAVKLERKGRPAG